ncbi:MAG: hypothetical protein VXX63_00295 [Bacteroidota bacterium]|nr:hypothetical protein [Bacteroidota bacterium]
MKKYTIPQNTSLLFLTLTQALGQRATTKQKRTQRHPFSILLILLLFCPSCAIYYTQTCPPISVHEKQQIQVEGGVSMPFTLMPGGSIGLTCGLTEKTRAQGFGRLLLNGTLHSQATLGHEFKLKDKSWLTLSGGYAQGSVSNEEYSILGSKDGYNITGNYQSILGKIQCMKTYSTRRNIGNWGIMLTTSHFSPDALIDLGYQNGVSLGHQHISQKAILFEPYLFVDWINKKSKKKRKFSLFFTNTWVYPLEEVELEQDLIDLVFVPNFFGTFGIKVSHKLF